MTAGDARRGRGDPRMGETGGDLAEEGLRYPEPGEGGTRARSHSDGSGAGVRAHAALGQVPGQRVAVGVWVLPRLLAAQVDPAVAQRVDDRLCAVVDVQLAQDRGDVVFHRLIGDAQDAGDLLVAEPL